MKSKTPLLLLGLLLVVGLAGLLWFVSGDSDTTKLGSTAVLGPKPAEVPDQTQTADVGVPAASDLERESVKANPTRQLDPAASSPVLVERGFDPEAIYGRVLGAESIPLEGAQILLFDAQVPRDELTEYLAKSTSDAEGYFRFKQREPHLRVLLAISAEGYLPLLDEHDTGLQEDFTLEVAASLSGRVVEKESKAPVAGARVAWKQRHWSGSALEEMKSLLTDAEGQFQVQGLPTSNDLTLYFGMPNQIPLANEVRLEAGEARQVELLLEDGLGLSGFVFDVATRSPVAGAQVYMDELELARSDEAGSFNLSRVDAALLMREQRELRIEAEDFCSTRWNPSEDKWTAGLLLELPMLRGATISGSVVDSENRPVGGARLSTWSNNRSPKEAKSWRSGLRATNRREGYSAYSDANGRFQITGLVPGSREVYVNASKRGYSRSGERASVPDSTSRAEVTIELASAASIYGVVYADGEPAPAAVISWRQERNRGSARSNDRGQYRLRNLPSGELSLSARYEDMRVWDGKQNTSDSLWLEAGESIEHDLSIDLATTVLAGSVLNEAGVGLGDIEVSAFSYDREAESFVRGEDLTASDGSFSVKIPLGGNSSYTVVAGKDSSEQRIEDVAPGSSGLKFIMPDKGGLFLRVRDSATGETLTDFDLHWKASADENFKQLDDDQMLQLEDGRIELSLPTGPVQLMAHAFDLGLRQVQINATVRAEAPFDNAEILLVTGTRLELELVSQDPDQNLGRFGGFLSKVTEQESSGSFWNGNNRFNTRMLNSSSDGLYFVTGLAPGRYRIRSWRNEYQFEPSTFEVPDQPQFTQRVTWSIKQDSNQDQ